MSAPGGRGCVAAPAPPSFSFAAPLPSPTRPLRSSSGGVGAVGAHAGSPAPRCGASPASPAAMPALAHALSDRTNQGATPRSALSAVPTPQASPASWLSEVPTPHSASMCGALSPECGSEAGEASPWSPPSAGRAARRAALAASPALALARRGAALLTLAARADGADADVATPSYYSPPPRLGAENDGATSEADSPSFGGFLPCTPGDDVASCASTGGTPIDTPAAAVAAATTPASVSNTASASAQRPTPAGGLSRDIRAAMSVRAAACTRYAALQSRKQAAAAKAEETSSENGDDEPPRASRSSLRAPSVSPMDARALLDARAVQLQAAVAQLAAARQDSALLRAQLAEASCRLGAYERAAAAAAARERHVAAELDAARDAFLYCEAALKNAEAHAAARAVTEKAALRVHAEADALRKQLAAANARAAAMARVLAAQEAAAANKGDASQTIAQNSTLNAAAAAAEEARRRLVRARWRAAARAALRVVRTAGIVAALRAAAAAPQQQRRGRHPLSVVLGALLPSKGGAVLSVEQAERDVAAVASSAPLRGTLRLSLSWGAR